MARSPRNLLGVHLRRQQGCNLLPAWPHELGGCLSTAFGKPMADKEIALKEQKPRMPAPRSPSPERERLEPRSGRWRIFALCTAGSPGVALNQPAEPDANRFVLSFENATGCTRRRGGTLR